MVPKIRSGESDLVVAQQGSGRPKRAQVQVACDTCRRRKTRCDALRPCGSCTARRTPCSYETQAGETYGQASKRKIEEISQERDVYVQLFELLRTRDERGASEILRQVRRGHDPGTIVNSVAATDTACVIPDSRSNTLATLLVNLAHSTGSIQDIVRLAMGSSTSHHLPSIQDFRKLRNRIVYFPYLESMLRESFEPVNKILPDQYPPVLPGKQLAISNSEPENEHGDTDDGIRSDHDPPWHVSAGPWTEMTTSDEAVSHLVSIFLTWHNPIWSFVEADLFLKGMQSKNLDSQFCSPFLVNSICAIASLQSEHDVAFPNDDGDRISRGQHFHDEAIRLWALEENRPSLTNMQALCILSLESNYRAKDRLGLSFVPIAAQLDRELPIHGDSERCAAQAVTPDEYVRARISAHCMVHCRYITMCISFMSRAILEPGVTGLPDVQEASSDHVETWTGFPLTRAHIPHWPKLYLRERCKFAGILREIHALIVARDGHRNSTIPDFAGAVESGLSRLHRWFERLPAELQYKWPMSSAVWELHASYHALVMIILTTARSRLMQLEELSADETVISGDANLGSRLARENLTNAIPHAHRSAQMLRDFRERYGLRITPAWLLQLQAVAANVLILDPALAHPTVAAIANSASFEGHIRDSHSAFDEVFRCLLGTGVEVMIARAIARMIYHTTLRQRIVLSRSAWNMLQIMSDTAWRPSDISRVNSIFPNFATMRGYDDNERLTELLLKWESINID